MNGGRRAHLAILVAATLLPGCAAWFFQPEPGAVRTPAAFGYAYSDVAIDSPDGTPLHAWLVRPADEPVGRVLYLHGNAQNVSRHLSLATWWVDAGFEVLALDYRGYGLSGGTPSLDGAVADVGAAGRWLTAHADGAPYAVFAQSLGASLAVLWLADDARARADVSALVLEAGFARFSGVAADVASGFWLTWPLQWVPRLTLAPLTDPVDVIERVGVPTLVVQSADDAIVDASHGCELYAAAAEPKRLVEARGPHIRAAADPAVRRAMLDFVLEGDRS